LRGRARRSASVNNTRLRYSSYLDKYMKLFEKYEGHPDREKIVARKMDWT